MRHERTPPTRCPCGSGLAHAECCGPLIAGIHAADSALALMRSRYVAYALGEAAYLLDTWHPRTRPATLAADGESPHKWIGLRILGHRRDFPAPGRAIVEFVARYKVGGRAHRMHEISRFVEEGGRWYYVDGDVDPVAGIPAGRA